MTTMGVKGLNASERLLFLSWTNDHVTHLLQELHWLKMEQWIKYKLTVLVYRCLQGLVSPYLANSLQRVSDIDARRYIYATCHHRPSSSRQHDSTLLTTALSTWLRPGHGTVFQTLWRRRHQTATINTVLCARSYPSLWLFARSAFLHCTSVFSFLIFVFLQSLLAVFWYCANHIRLLTDYRN